MTGFRGFFSLRGFGGLSSLLGVSLAKTLISRFAGVSESLRWIGATVVLSVSSGGASSVASSSGTSVTAASFSSERDF